VIFYIISDDASRLFIDGNLVALNGGEHAVKQVAGTVTLSAGYHDLRLDYENSGGPGAMTFSYDPDGPGPLAARGVPAAVLLPAGATPGVTDISGITALNTLRVLSLANNQIVNANSL